MINGDPIKIGKINCQLELGKWSISKINEMLNFSVKEYPEKKDKIAYIVSRLIGTPFEFESNLPILPRNTLRVRLSTLDCITFVYTVLALANSSNFEEFLSSLITLRYKEDAKGGIDNHPDTGNIFDFAYESFLMNAIEKGFLKDVTFDLIKKEKLIKVSVELARFRRSELKDSEQLYVRPRYGERTVTDYFLAKEDLDSVNPENLQSGDLILMTKGPFNSSGERNPTLITHLAICHMEGKNIYFCQSTRHFSWRPYANSDSPPDYTGIFYDNENKKEQIGIGVAGMFVGPSQNTILNGDTYFGFDQGRKRSLKDYLEFNAIGVKFLRPI